MSASDTMLSSPAIGIGDASPSSAASSPLANGCSSSATRCSTSAAISASSRSEEHTSELQSLMRISYAVFCLKKKTSPQHHPTRSTSTTLQKTQHTQYHQ